MTEDQEREQRAEWARLTMFGAVLFALSALFPLLEGDELHGIIKTVSDWNWSEERADGKGWHIPWSWLFLTPVIPLVRSFKRIPRRVEIATRPKLLDYTDWEDAQR